MMHNFDIKEKIVRKGGSRIFENWHRCAGISMEDFIDGLRWLCDDPMPEGRLTRELGVIRDRNSGMTPEQLAEWGDDTQTDPAKIRLYRLRRVYYNDGSFAGFYDEDGNLWGHTQDHASISAVDRV